MQSKPTHDELSLDEAIETLGELISQAGGRGYDALETVKDAIPPRRNHGGRWTIHECSDCGRIEGEVPQGGCCPGCGHRSEPLPIPVVPCNGAAIERVATKLAELQGYHIGPLDIDRRSAVELLRAAGEGCPNARRETAG